MRARIGAPAALLALLLALGAGAAEAAAEPRKGPETGLPLPRYVSLKAATANVRRGPGLTHRVDWVFVRRGMPLQIIAEYGHWRRVRDMDAATGWVHYALLRGERTAVVVAETLTLRKAPDEAAAATARAERGVVLDLEACIAAWCEVSRGSVEGWAPKRALWGADPEETFD
ncbi:MAG: SH3 domain-containing protein [Paracoccaceae bacterium]